MASNKTLRTAAAGVGGGGSVVGAAVDMFAPGVGTVIGGVSNAIAAALGLAQEPEVPEVDPVQEQAMGMGAQALAELSAQSGLSAEVVGQIGQLGRAEKANEALVANTLSAGLSPYDRKRVMDRLMERSIGVNQSLSDKIALLDPTAEANRARAVVSGSAVVGSQAERLAEMRLKRQMIKDQYQSDMALNFANSMTQFMTSLNVGIDLIGTSGKDAATVASAATATGNAATATGETPIVTPEAAAAAGATSALSQAVSGYLAGLTPEEQARATRGLGIIGG